MKLSKAKIFILPLISLTALVSIIPFLVVSCGSVSSSQKFDYPYNSIVTDYSESTDPQDVKVLDYYQNNTISLQYSFSGGTSYGTAWFWSADANFTYFATNLHVVNSVLKYNANSPLPYAERFSLKTSLDTYPYNPLVFKYTTYNNKTPQILSNVGLKKIHVLDKITNLNTNGKPLYSDLAILQTTTRLPRQQRLDFIDTVDELEYALSDIKNKTYYISGFPYSESNRAPLWTTGKYKWVNNDEYQSDGIGWSTAWRMFGARNYLTNNTLGHEIKVAPANPHLSYAMQLILPGLNLSGGSSGSLVSVWNETKNILQPLGIYWGVYVGEDTANATNVSYYGGVDLFYSDSFKLHNDSIDYSYDNSKF